MRQLNSKAQFYRSMAMMYDAGLPLSSALAKKHPYHLRKICSEISEEIAKNGTTMSARMSFYPRIFTKLECRLIKAGEQTGRLDVIFKSLSEWFEFRNKLKGRFISGMTYPVLLFHFAAFAIPFINYLLGKATIAGTVIQIALFLCPPYSFLILFIVFNKAKRLFNMEAPLFLSRMILHVPVLGNLFRKMDYMRFFSVFGLTVEAGLSFKNSIFLGAEACRNRYIRNVFLRTADNVEKEGCSFTEAFSQFIPREDRDSSEASMIKTGELSGKTSETAKQVAAECQHEVEETLKLVSFILPKIVYMIVAFYMAMEIVWFWMQMTSAVNNIP